MRWPSSPRISNLGPLTRRLLARLTNVLLAFEQYSTALPLLEPLLKDPAGTEELSLDYVQAKFHTSGAGRGPRNTRRNPGFAAIGKLLPAPSPVVR